MLSVSGVPVVTFLVFRIGRMRGPGQLISAQRWRTAQRFDQSISYGNIWRSAEEKPGLFARRVRLTPTSVALPITKFIAKKNQVWFYTIHMDGVEMVCGWEQAPR